MFSTIFSQIGIPVVISVIAEALKKIDSPLAKNAADALGNLGGAIKTGAITAEQIAEANRHAEKMAEIEMQNHQSTLATANETVRAEISSNDAYVRRMRPTFGYFMAVTWAAQMLALAYVIVFETEKSAFVLNAMGNLSAIWAMGLSVLGIYVYKRSEEKRAVAPAPGIIAWNKPTK